LASGAPRSTAHLAGTEPLGAPRRGLGAGGAVADRREGRCSLKPTRTCWPRSATLARARELPGADAGAGFLPPCRAGPRAGQSAKPLRLRRICHTAIVQGARGAERLGVAAPTYDDFRGTFRAGLRASPREGCGWRAAGYSQPDPPLAGELRHRRASRARSRWRLSLRHFFDIFSRRTETWAGCAGLSDGSHHQACRSKNTPHRCHKHGHLPTRSARAQATAPQTQPRRTAGRRHSRCASHLTAHSEGVPDRPSRTPTRPTGLSAHRTATEWRTRSDPC
jgi:hypothetical protein